MASNAMANVTPIGAAGETTQKASCEHHGEYEQRVSKIMGREFKSICPVCQKETKEKEQARERELKEWEDRKRLESKLGASMIPPRFAEKTFESYKAASPQQEKALNTCMDYAANFEAHAKAGRCLLMFGKPGTGKTHLAASIANDVNGFTRKTAVYRTVGGILQSLKATYSNGSTHTEKQIMDGLTTPDLLIIDEIGATKPTDFELATLFAIVNSRYEQVLPTAVVSNLMPAELAGAMGERCVDRLREGGAIVLVFDWESARSKVKA